MQNAYYNFTELKVTSLNSLFCQTVSQSYYKDAKQQILIAGTRDLCLTAG